MHITSLLSNAIFTVCDYNVKSENSTKNFGKKACDLFQNHLYLRVMKGTIPYRIVGDTSLVL